MQITYTDGGSGTATVEEGRHGGWTLVLRKGCPVAAEVVAGVKVEHVTDALLGALGVASGSVSDLSYDFPSLVK